MSKMVLNEKNSIAMFLALVASLKACAKQKDLYQGSRIHAVIWDHGLLEKNPYLASSLISMYAKCGALARAQQVLDKLPIRDVVSWNALIAGYAQHGLGQEAQGCFRQMQGHGYSPNAVTYACILKACGITQDAELGKEIHEAILTQGLLDKDVVLGSALVFMYAKCGVLTKAQKVLDDLLIREVVSWNALISGYAQEGQGQQALSCFERMQTEGVSPDAITYACALKACGISQEAGIGKQIHDTIARQGLLEKNVVLGNALVDMYAKCGVLGKAQSVFNELLVREVVSWNALIAGYVEHGQSKEAIGCFQLMQTEGLSPNAITYSCVLKACSILQEADMGERIHYEVVRQGLLKEDVILGSSLVDMYAKCGELAKAQKVFDELRVQGVASWNALIAGYALQGQGQEALGCFHGMRFKGFSPDAITYACILKVCGIMHEADMGKQVHDEIINSGLLEENIVLGNALVDMYAKCGALTKAQKALDELPFRNVVSWSALIAGYVQQGEGQEALRCFQCMQSEGISPDAITYACILKVCGITQDADLGKQIHDEIVSQGLLEKNVMLGNALVDMYAKCGVHTKARNVLDQLFVRDAVSWNALIAGYVQHGLAEKAVDLFWQMQSEGFSPTIISWNALIGGYAHQGLVEEALHSFHRMQQEGISVDTLTFVNVLNACSHSGLVDEGLMYFKNMRENYDMTPGEEHYTCLVDLFGRALDFGNAIGVIDMMPCVDYPPVWSTLLGACQKQGNVKLGRLAFAHAIQLDAENAQAYVSMANIYVAAGMLNLVRSIDLMTMRNATKESK